MLVATNLAAVPLAELPGVVLQDGQAAHLWRPVSDEVVSVSSMQTTFASQGSIPNAYVVNWDDSRLRYWQAKQVTLLGTNYPRSMYGSPGGNVTSVNGACTWFLEFHVTGLAFEICAFGRSSYRLWIDGRLYAGLGVQQVAGGPGAITATKFTFATSGTRKIRYESNQPFGAIRVENSASFAPSSREYATWMCVGDSFDEGTGGSAGSFNGSVAMLGQKFGVAMVNSGSGGTGYSTNGGIVGRYAYIDRIQDVALNQPAVLFVNGTVNGSSTVTEAIAGAYYDEVRRVSPHTRIIVRGPSWATTPVPSSILSERAALIAACSARGIQYIDPLVVNAEWFNSGNTQTFFGTTTRSTATATVSEGSVTALTPLSSLGCWDLLDNPVVSIAGGGTGATARANLSFAVTAVEPLKRGSGYTMATAVISGGGGAGAVYTANIVDGQVVGYTKVSGGTGYTSRPSIEVIGDGVGAVASAFVSGTIESYTVTSGGSGYSSASVLIAMSGDGAHPKQNGHDLIAEKTAVTAIEKIPQTITFVELADMAYTLTPRVLAASASSGLAVTFTVVSGPASVTGNTLQINGAGQVVVRAMQEGNENYAAAPTVERAFLVTENYESWRNSSFTSLEIEEQEMVGPNADFDSDGYVNVLEYALGFDPKVSDFSDVPWISTSETEWLYNYTFLPGRAVVQAEASTDLVTWSDVGLSSRKIAETEDSETWQVGYPLEAPSVYFRLKVTAP